MATKNDTTRDLLAELGCQLDDVRTVLDLMTDVDPGESAEAQQLHSAALTAFRLVARAMDQLQAVDAAA